VALPFIHRPTAAAAAAAAADGGLVVRSIARDASTSVIKTISYSDDDETNIDHNCMCRRRSFGPRAFFCAVCVCVCVRALACEPRVEVNALPLLSTAGR
jgi:hypothetical protein